MQRLSNDFNNISIISFSRNFGKEPALCAGLDNFNNDACIILDADLQHPPELIPQMVQLWSEQGYDVVEGIKSSRGKESLLSKFTASTFYKLFNKACGIDLNNASDFKLIDKKVVNAWKMMPESITFFRGMSAVIIATLLNFIINRGWSFKSSSNFIRSLILYIILFCLNTTFSTNAISFMVKYGMIDIVAKVITMCMITA